MDRPRQKSNGDGNGSGDDNDDADTKKLRGALAGAILLENLMSNGQILLD